MDRRCTRQETGHRKRAGNCSRQFLRSEGTVWSGTRAVLTCERENPALSFSSYIFLPSCAIQFLRRKKEELAERVASKYGACAPACWNLRDADLSDIHDGWHQRYTCARPVGPSGLDTRVTATLWEHASGL